MSCVEIVHIAVISLQSIVLASNAFGCLLDSLFAKLTPRFICNIHAKILLKFWMLCFSKNNKFGRPITKSWLILCCRAVLLTHLHNCLFINGRRCPMSHDLPFVTREATPL